MADNDQGGNGKAKRKTYTPLPFPITTMDRPLVAVQISHKLTALDRQLPTILTASPLRVCKWWVGMDQPNRSRLCYAKR